MLLAGNPNTPYIGDGYPLDMESVYWVYVHPYYWVDEHPPHSPKLTAGTPTKWLPCKC